MAGIYVFTQQINIINTDQKLMRPIEFQYLSVFLDVPSGVL
jgi:hypothetical protein